MGGNRSFSKTKSSRKTRENILSKKKNRKKEFKRRRHDSVSSYSDDDSVTPQRPTKSSRSKSNYRTRKTKNKKRLSSHSDDLSVSSDSNYSSSSDKAHKDRKVRHARVRLASSKKRTRKRLPSPDNSADDYIARKRKRSDKGHDAMKKPSKKKLKKYLSDSSISDSECCSTCSNSDDNRKRRQVVLDDVIGSPRGRESNKKKRRVRSPSCSSCEKNSDLNGDETHHDKAVSPEIKPMRLRSVIVVACESHDERETRLEDDFHKEEIVYDQDDYPSSKSLDSDHDQSKMGSDGQFPSAYDKSIHAGNVSCKEVADNIKYGTNEGCLSDANYYDAERASVRYLDEEKGKDDSVSVSAGGANGLESVLRQRALENLRKYRKEFKTGQKSNNTIMVYEHDANASVPEGAYDEANKSTKQDVSNVHGLKQPSDALLRRERSERIEVQKFCDSEQIKKDSEMAKQTVDNPANQSSLLGCLVSKTANNEQIKPTEGGVYKAQELKLTSGALLKREISEIIEVQKLSDSEQIKKDLEMDKQKVENPTKQLTLSGFSEGGNVASSHTSVEKPVSRSDTNPRPSNNAGGSSIMGQSSVGPISQERNIGQQNEAEDASQFKQKTMSVMRGGEMVEVSYKVYIPQRAPSLARRQLRK